MLKNRKQKNSQVHASTVGPATRQPQEVGKVKVQKQSFGRRETLSRFSKEKSQTHVLHNEVELGINPGA